MITLAILSNYIDEFHIDSKYLPAFLELGKAIEKRGIRVIRVSIYSYDRENANFRDYITLEPDGTFRKHHESIKPDIIWVRSEDALLSSYTLLEEHFRVFPSKKIALLASNKYEQSVLLKEFQPKTALLHLFFSNPSIASSFGERIVLKPVQSSSGKGIEFFGKDELLSKKDAYYWLGYLYIVQEFIDFSGWCEGIAEGIHDVRLVYIGGNLSHSTLRQPKAGSLKSNVWAWWTEQFLSLDRIPGEVIQLADAIIHRLGIDEKNIFSLDFWYAREQHRWYLFEINHSPWVFLEDLLDCFRETYAKNVANFISSLAQND